MASVATVAPTVAKEATVAATVPVPAMVATDGEELVFSDPTLDLCSRQSSTLCTTNPFNNTI